MFDTGVCEQFTPFMPAFALQSWSRACSPAPESDFIERITNISYPNINISPWKRFYRNNNKHKPLKAILSIALQLLKKCFESDFIRTSSSPEECSLHRHECGEAEFFSFSNFARTLNWSTLNKGIVACSPAPDFVLWKRFYLHVLASGGVFFSQTPVGSRSISAGRVILY